MAGHCDSRPKVLRLRGIVQGVGMRPFIYRIASSLGLVGEVYNDGDGVTLKLWGDDTQLQTFNHRLQHMLPPSARIDQMLVDNDTAVCPRPKTFNIVDSNGAGTPGIIPDRASCSQCIAEIFNAQDRRYQHPFNSCTECGPRYSIMREGSWDRRNTAMAAFSLCQQCLTEYQSPDDRRFHAETVACPACGPKLFYQERHQRLETGQIAAAAAAIARGDVIAVQGMGCFQLICDALNHQAIALLRRVKQRPRKPLAIMVAGRPQLDAYADASAAEWALLSSAQSPIVIVKQRDTALPDLLAPGLHTVGVMLANTPLHHLLMSAVARPLVVSSANLSGAPTICTPQALRDMLPAFGGGVLYTDRAILKPLDDSVAQVMGSATQLLRRARGYVPRALPLPRGLVAPPILALGGHHKNTLCLLEDGRLQLSTWQGDLDSPAQRQAYDSQVATCAAGTRHYACDHHPDYYSSRRAVASASEQPGSGVHQVWHHHAHAAACLAEHGRHADAGPVLAVVFDGSGYGPDASIWGGEFLVANYRGFRRRGHLQTLRLIGGEQAATQPWRSLWSHLHASGGWPQIQQDHGKLAIVSALQQQPISAWSYAQLSAVNAPLSSSVGRLFDAVAAALEICFDGISYEGEAAMRLQALAETSEDSQAYPFAIRGDDELIAFDLAPMWPALFADLEAGLSKAIIARRFHSSLARATAAMVDGIFAIDKDWQEPLVALSGGVFQNALLHEETSRYLQANGFRVIAHGEVPANDSGLSLGQAVVAAAQFSPAFVDRGIKR